MTTGATLWLAVVALGLYHGLNPAMGWPLAVANGLAERRDAAVLRTLLPLGGGHFAAMALVLVPLAGLGLWLEWSPSLRIAAGTAVLAFGLYRLVDRRHPRALARVPPSRLAWWSFLMATAHGAGLMLLPFVLGLCRTDAGGGTAAAWHAEVDGWLLRSGLATTLAVAALHTLAMMAAGLAIAWAVYRWLGLQFLRRSWFNLDVVWALSLVVAGAAGIAAALAGA